MKFTTTRRAFAGMIAALFAAPDVDAASLSPLEEGLIPLTRKPGFITGDRDTPIEDLIFPRASAVEPEPVAVPGLAQIVTVRAVLTVTTDDGRLGVLQLDLAPDVPVRFRHMGGFEGEIPVPGDSLRHFPNWFQREIGYAALGAVTAVEEA